MRKTIILLALLALLIFAAPFVLARLSEGSNEPVPEITPEPTAEPTPTPTIEVVEIIIPAPDESSTPKPTATPTADSWSVFPVIDEPVTESPTQRPSSGSQSSRTPTPIPQVSVPKGAAFVLTIRGKSITIAKQIDEQTLEQSPGWLDSSAKPGKEGVCVVYGHRNRNHFQVLKDVDYGDSILVTMPDGKTYTYVIESTEILESDEELRIPTISGKHLMLTTCYPFYYTGHAPKKYIVIASLS
jgi:LPXTG-site transpeptidase (sortase) family protein